MINRRGMAFGLAATTATLASCSGTSDEASAPGTPAPRTALFVGNSLTRVEGGLDLHVKALAAALRPARSLTTQRVTQDGATLAALRQDGAVRQAVQAGGHDAVVLQDDLPEYGGPGVEPFKAAVRAFHQDILASGGRTVLFMAWAYPRLTWILQPDIAAAHRSMGTELGIPVAPVGLAFEAARAQRPALSMLGDDGEHESLHGMYLAACVTTATLFQTSPEGAAYVPEDVSADDAAFLQRIAWLTVAFWNATTGR